MIFVMKSFEYVNDLQNMFFEFFQYDYSCLESVLRLVNVILFVVVDFSMCEYRMIEGIFVFLGSSVCVVVFYKELQGKCVMGIMCLIDYVFDYKLDVLLKKGFYLCKCSGLFERVIKFILKLKIVKCFLNLWECQINV